MGDIKLSRWALWFFIMVPLLSFGQGYTPGNTYYGNNNYTEYHSGNLPIILSAPHGGYLKPSNIPDRNCSGCVTVKDRFTKELTLEIAEAIHKKTQCYPHVIINNLHRVKLDANREIIEATGGDSNSFVYWHDYNNFIDSARLQISNQSIKGLFLDIHGHGHSMQRIEIGYLLSKTDLQLTNAGLNSAYAISKSSIKNLANSNLLSVTHADLIRGNYSLGSLLGQKGYAAVPSLQIPFPLTNEPYFSGGYNTVKWGSKNGGEIDGIQLEHHSTLRTDSVLRKNYADSLANILLDYLDLLYFVNFSQNYCFYNSIKKWPRTNFRIVPNPVGNTLTVLSKEPLKTIALYDVSGRKIAQFKNTNSIELSFLSKGIYLVVMEFDGRNKIEYRRIVKY